MKSRLTPRGLRVKKWQYTFCGKSLLTQKDPLLLAGVKDCLKEAGLVHLLRYV